MVDDFDFFSKGKHPKNEEANISILIGMIRNDSHLKRLHNSLISVISGLPG